MTEAALRELRADLHGEVLTPRDPGYDAVRKVFNAMIDRRPAAIARCTSTAHVVHCVQFVRTHGLTISVRGGGHSVAGKAGQIYGSMRHRRPCNDGDVEDLHRDEVTSVGEWLSAVRKDLAISDTILGVLSRGASEIPGPCAGRSRCADPYAD
jgi:hypothetical protein